MEHSEGGNRGNQEGRPRPSQHHRQQPQPAAGAPSAASASGSRQQQPEVPTGQQQQQQLSLALQQQQQLYLQQQGVAAGVYGGGGGGRHLPQQQQLQQQQPMDMMSASAAVSGAIQNEYIATQQLRQRAQQQYLQQQYAAAAAAAAAGNTNPAASRGYPPPRTLQQQQQQYTQQLSSYQQQQIAMQQSMMAAAAASVSHGATAAAAGAPPYPLSHQQQYAAAAGRMDPTMLAASNAVMGQQVLPPAQPTLPLQQQRQQQQQQPYLQPRVGRLPADRPLIKLSVSLIDTYKTINTVYYQEREARRALKAKEKVAPAPSAGDETTKRPATKKAKSADAADTTVGGRGPKKGTKTSGSNAATAASSSSTATPGSGSGPHNNGWDDENYDYIITQGELFYGRYRIQERIGKGSFGQVVRAIDEMDLSGDGDVGGREVAIKIIKSKKPFLMQSKTEIELLTHLNEKDPKDENNIVRLIAHFIYRNHQCLVFEMLSLNLYELLKNTQFGGVSLNLIRKFSKQVLKALSFLARRDVDIIHCDLKPENILLRHPKKSGVKVIDFGSSCRSNKRMYSYIQSRFYRSPEVMLGLPYATSIDMWSLGCILAEMHTGEPLFSGSDQFDQMQKIVKLLGMLPTSMVEQASDTHRTQFFERVVGPGGLTWSIKQINPGGTSRHAASASQELKATSQPSSPVVPSQDPIGSLNEVIRAETNRKKKYPPSETGNSPGNYEMFVDLIYRMLTFDPRKRIKPEEALLHPFLTGTG